MQWYVKNLIILTDDFLNSPSLGDTTGYSSVSSLSFLLVLTLSNRRILMVFSYII